MKRWYFDLSEESRLHLEKLYKSKNVSEPSIWKDSEEKSNESWKKELEQCSDLDLATSTLHLLTFFFATLALFNLYFVFPILYFVFCISYFAFSHLFRLFFCFTGFLNQRAEEEQVFSAAYIAVIICLLVTFCRTAHCMFLLNDVALYIMVILQFSCNRFCFKKLNVFSSQLHCRELPSSAACQFALASALPPSLSLCLMFVCISYLVYCTSILEDGLVTHSFSCKKDDLVQLKRPEMVVAPRYELLTLLRLLALFSLIT